MQNKLRKSSDDKVLTGVCGGIAEYLGLPSIAVRLILILLPATLPIYVILSFFMPYDDERLTKY